MVTTCTVVQICYKSILLVLTKTPGRWKTVLVVVTLLKGHRLIPGFNSLMLGGHLKLTNHWTSYDLSSPSWFLQTSITRTHTLIKHNAAVSQVIKNNRLLKQYSLTYIKSLPECVPWKMSKLSPSHLYKAQKKEERTPALYSTRKEQSCSWIELSGCLEHGKAELVSICTRTTCWVTRSPASVKSSRLLLWLNAPCHHLHATSWFIPQQQDVENVRLRCIQQDAGGKHVDMCKFSCSVFTSSDLVTFQLCTVHIRTYRRAHSLSVSRSRHHKECQSRLKDEVKMSYVPEQSVTFAALSIWYHSAGREPWKASVSILLLWKCILLSDYLHFRNTCIYPKSIFD